MADIAIKQRKENSSSQGLWKPTETNNHPHPHASTASAAPHSELTTQTRRLGTRGDLSSAHCTRV